MNEQVESKPIDRWLPWLFVVFFVVVFAVNGVMVYVAASSWTGVETRQHYVKGRDYNRILEAVERQNARGWTGNLSVRPRKDGDVRLEFRLADARAAALTGAGVTARLVRPTREGYDFDVRMDDYGAGRYIADLHVPLPGQWDVRIVASHPSGEFRLTRRIVVR